jgi:hypothetical protein
MSDLYITTNCLEANDRIHSNVIGLLRLLPEDRCHVFDDEDSLSLEEISAVKTIQARLEVGDESEFVDWEDIKEII